MISTNDSVNVLKALEEHFPLEYSNSGDTDSQCLMTYNPLSMFDLKIKQPYLLKGAIEYEIDGIVRSLDFKDRPESLWFLDNVISTFRFSSAKAFISYSCMISNFRSSDSLLEFIKKRQVFESKHKLSVEEDFDISDIKSWLRSTYKRKTSLQRRSKLNESLTLKLLRYIKVMHTVSPVGTPSFNKSLLNELNFSRHSYDRTSPAYLTLTEDCSYSSRSHDHVLVEQVSAIRERFSSIFQVSSIREKITELTNSVNRSSKDNLSKLIGSKMELNYVNGDGNISEDSFIQTVNFNRNILRVSFKEPIVMNRIRKGGKIYFFGPKSRYEFIIFKISSVEIHLSSSRNSGVERVIPYSDINFKKVAKHPNVNGNVCLGDFINKISDSAKSFVGFTLFDFYNMMEMGNLDSSYFGRNLNEIIKAKTSDVPEVTSSSTVSELDLIVME
jgi:hypothetical protein